MDDDGIAVGWFLALVMYAIVQCIVPVQDNVSAENWARATQVCASNGGVNNVRRPSYFSRTTDVICANRVKVSFR